MAGRGQFGHRLWFQMGLGEKNPGLLHQLYADDGSGIADRRPIPFAPAEQSGEKPPFRREFLWPSQVSPLSMWPAATTSVDDLVVT